MGSPEYIAPGEKLVRMENERKFFVDWNKVPQGMFENLNSLIHSEILQGYLPDGTRLRKETFINGELDGMTVYTQTVKVKDPQSHGISKEETELGLSEEQFNLEWKKVTASVEKTRYRKLHNGRNLEIDVFHGEKNGQLIEGRGLIEIEFDSRDEAEAYLKEDWMIDVTNRVSTKKIARGSVPFDLPQIIPLRDGKKEESVV